MQNTAPSSNAAQAKILVTAAGGELGRLVVGDLVRRVPAEQVIAGVRNPDKAGSLRDLGVEIRHVDYEQSDAMTTAFNGIGRLLLISSPNNGVRVPEHLNVLAAAKAAGVGEIAYTSILRADSSPLLLAHEHRSTELAIEESRLRYVFLRNGWYNENDLRTAQQSIEHGAVMAASGDGKVSSAARSDYAEAAAAVLTSAEPFGNRAYELAGDTAYTRAEYAAMLAKASGKPVAFREITEAEYARILEGFGLPDAAARIIAQSDTGGKLGGLYDDGHQLRELIGHPTVPMQTSVAALWAAQPA